MIFPLRDDQPCKRVAYVNYSLIAVNVAVFLYGFWLGQHDQQGWDSFHHYTMVPHNFQLAFAGTPGYSVAGSFLTIFTSMFLHGGWLHLIGNMWVLWIFGDNIESHIGHVAYLLFDLLCGFIAGMAHVWANPVSDIPTLGASGAIAGIMGAFLLRYPEAKVQIFVLYGWRAGVYWAAAWIILACWFFLQLFGQVLSHLIFGTQQTGGIAYWAHLGGFLAGMILIKLIPGDTKYSHGGWVDKQGKEIRQGQ